MQKYNVHFLDRYPVAKGTMAFEFEKPENFTFQAGQYLSLALPELLYKDDRGEIRTFTIAAAPHAETLLIVTRMTGSGFKQTLAEMPLKTEVSINGPMGEMTLDENAPAVFLAGGIGITPFRSIILELLHIGQKVPITLLYSNRNRNVAAYHSLFVHIANTQLQNFTYVPTLTEDDPRNKKWPGERRLFTSDFIHDYVKNMSESIFYMSGPPNLVNTVTKTLSDMGIADDHIRSESFWGYE